MRPHYVRPSSLLRLLLLTVAVVAALAAPRSRADASAETAVRATLEASHRSGPAAALPETGCAGAEVCARGASRAVVPARLLVLWPTRSDDRRLPASASRARTIDRAADAYAYRIFLLRSGGSSLATTTPPPAV